MDEEQITESYRPTPGERPLAVYRKADGMVLVLFKGARPCVMLPGDTLTFTYEVTAGLELELIEPASVPL